MSRQCAYCGSKGPLTREHIWPSCIINRFENNLRTYNGKIGKFHRGDPTIRDVCSKCNNEKLGKLDKYLCDIHDENLSDYVKHGDATSLEYDYNLLLRSLLKISYNSYRAHKSDEDNRIHKDFIEYIIGEMGRPRKVMVRLQVVTTAEAQGNIANKGEVVYPSLIRCCSVKYNGVLSDRFCIRLIAIKSYWFFIIFPYWSASRLKYEELVQGMNDATGMPAGVELDPSDESIHIPVEKTTWFSMHMLSSMIGAVEKSQEQ